jgi:hypothetical protein
LVAVVVVPVPVPVEPEPPPLPVLEVVGGALTVLPPHAASMPATATAINGVRNDDTVAHAAWRVKKRWVDMCAPRCLSVIVSGCAGVSLQWVSGRRGSVTRGAG